MALCIFLACTATFVTVVAVIVVGVRRIWAEQSRINQLPIMDVSARVTAKRANTSGRSNSFVTTRYYATFELADGERMEMEVGSEYGLLTEGDAGELSHQGPRFLGFRRN